VVLSDRATRSWPRSKPGASRRAVQVGTEHEKVPFYRADHSPVPYGGERGIRALLEGMCAHLGWERIEDGENLIGLYDAKGEGAISLEPGGQFELSGAPLHDAHAPADELDRHLTACRKVAEPLGIGFLTLGMSPKWSLAETPVMPKSRYAIMARYMPKVGTRGLDMMFRTATVQSISTSRGTGHGGQNARGPRAAAGDDRLVRQFAVHRRQAQWTCDRSL
jgi:glutamate--cysteine ligase